MTAIFSGTRSPARILSMVSTPRVEPIRQGVHLPQDSIAQNSIAKIRAGDRVPENIAVIEDLCNTMKFGSLCALGGFTPYPVMSALKHFREDFGPVPTRLQAAE